MTKNLGNHTLAGLSWMSLAYSAQFTVQFLVTIVLARLLDPADFGVVAAAMVIIGFSSLLGELGLGAALVQRRDLVADHIGTAFTVTMASGLLLCALMVVGAPFFARFFSMPGLAPVVQSLSATFILNGLSSVAENLLARHFRFKALSIIKLVSQVGGQGVISVALALAGWGYWSLVIGALCQGVVQTFLLVGMTRHEVRLRFCTQAFKGLLRVGSGMSIARILNFVALNGAGLVIARELGPVPLGLYDRAFRLSSLPTAIYERIAARVILSSFSRLQDDNVRLAAAYRRGLALTALLGMPLTAILALLSPEIVRAVYGPKWEGAIDPFTILVFATFFRLSYRVSQSTLIAVGQVYWIAGLQAVYAVTVLGGAYMAAQFGLPAVAAAVSLAIFSNYVMLSWKTLKATSLPMPAFLAAHGPGAVLALIAGGTAYMVKVLGGSSLSDLGVLTLFGVVAALVTAGLLAFPSTRIWGIDGLWLRGRVVAALRSRLGVRSRDAV